MAGLIASAPIYVNGLLSLLFVCILPGLACAPFLRIEDFPQRWYVVFLVSLVANHLLVTLIALFHLDPLVTYRFAVCVAVLVIGVGFALGQIQVNRGKFAERSVLKASDVGWFAASLVALGITYFNVWKHGLPNIFIGSDPLVSWNYWATIWSQGQFPVNSYGYPQLVPTLWAVTYIFTGSPEQYFAFYVYIGLITLPLLLNAMVLGRICWWYPLVSGFAFTWLIAEIQAPWLRSTLQVGFPDWIAVIFASCGVALFAFGEPEDHFDRDKITNALLALCLVALATAIKPLHGLLALAILGGISTDACRKLEAGKRNRFLIAAVGLVAALVFIYAIYYAHLQIRALPLPALGDRVPRALALFNSTFSLPFRIVIFLGLLLCPFVRRLRWFALPLYIGILAWVASAAYDLRNTLSFLLIAAFVPLYAASRHWLEPKAIATGRQWRVRDGVVATILALATFGLTSPLAVGDEALRARFAKDQLRIDAGTEINEMIGGMLGQGCRVFSAVDTLSFIAAFAPFREQIQVYHHTLPSSDALANSFRSFAGCTAVLHAPHSSDPSVREFIEQYARDRNLKKILEYGGLELLITPR